MLVLAVASAQCESIGRPFGYKSFPFALLHLNDHYSSEQS